MSDAELARLSRPGDAIDAVIFDMDGVLADSEPLHQHAIRVLLAEYGVDWAPDGRDPTVGLTSLEAFAVICARHALPHDPRRLDELYTARVLPLLRRSEEHTSELQSLAYLVCRLLLEKKKKKK